MCIVSSSAARSLEFHQVRNTRYQSKTCLTWQFHILSSIEIRSTLHLPSLLPPPCHLPLSSLRLPSPPTTSPLQTTLRYRETKFKIWSFFFFSFGDATFTRENKIINYYVKRDVPKFGDLTLITVSCIYKKLKPYLSQQQRIQKDLQTRSWTKRDYVHWLGSLETDDVLWLQYQEKLESTKLCSSQSVNIRNELRLLSSGMMSMDVIFWCASHSLQHLALSHDGHKELMQTRLTSE